MALPTSGLVAWYDADDASTFTFGTGSAVSQWRDKSGNTRHLAQATAGQRPTRSGTLNGKSVVVYDGTDDKLAATWTTLNQPLTVAVVFQSNSSSGVQAVVDGGSGVASLYRVTADLYFDAGTTFGHAISNTTPYLIVWVADSGGSKERVNSVQVGTSNTGTGGYPALAVGAAAAGGATDYLNGFIAEVAIWSRALSAGEITGVESDLTTKWFPAGGGGDYDLYYGASEVLGLYFGATAIDPSDHHLGALT